nr:M28 family peptidase [Endozoicomonas sp. G2_1]
MDTRASRLKGENCRQNQDYETSVVTIDKCELLQHVYYLSSDQLAGREIGSKGSYLAQQYIIEQLQLAKIKPFKGKYGHDFVHHKTFKRYQGRNIVAQIEANSHSDSYIVITAHYDHIGTQGKHVYNGADDNASGVATLLSIAKALQLKPLNTNVLLLFTDGEEAGLLGVSAFLEQQPKIISQTLLNINLDMLAGSRSTKRLHYLSYDLSKNFTRAQIKEFKAQHHTFSIRVKYGFNGHIRRATSGQRRWRLASDHGAFYRNNIPFVYYGVGEHINYHKKSDTYNNINHDFFWRASELVYHQIRLLDKYLI